MSIFMALQACRNLFVFISVLGFDHVVSSRGVRDRGLHLTSE